MKYEDIPNDAQCMSCNQSCDGSYHTTTDREGEVLVVLCTRCGKMEQLMRYQKDQIITTSLQIRAVLDVHCYEAEVKKGKKTMGVHPLIQEIHDGSNKVTEACRIFSEKVWLPKMCQQESEAHTWGKSADFPLGKFRTLCSAGRVLFTMVDAAEENYVTLIAISGSHTYVNIQGIHATAEKAVELITSFSLAYEKGEIQLVDDKNISLG